MKKLVILLFILVSGFSSFAKGPTVPLCQAFDGRYNNSDGVKIFESRQKNNYYYSIDVSDNQEIINQLKAWAEETEKLADSVSTSISNGKYNTVLIIPDSEINIGIIYSDDKDRIKIFLQSPHPFM